MRSDTHTFNSENRGQSYPPVFEYVALGVIVIMFIWAFTIITAPPSEATIGNESIKSTLSGYTTTISYNTSYGGYTAYLMYDGDVIDKEELSISQRKVSLQLPSKRYEAIFSEPPERYNVVFENESTVVKNATMVVRE